MTDPHHITLVTAANDYIAALRAEEAAIIERGARFTSYVNARAALIQALVTAECAGAWPHEEDRAMTIEAMRAMARLDESRSLGQQRTYDARDKETAWFAAVAGLELASEVKP